MTAGEYILALDVGNKRIGVAIAHRVARLPRPLTALNNSPKVMQEIADLVAREDASLVVVGLPRGMDGGYTEQTRAAEAFQQELARALPVTVVAGDETLTSVQAEAELGSRPHAKGEVDALAACYILESFLRDNPVEQHS